MKTLVLLNPAAGTLANSRTQDETARIQKGFAAAGAEVTVRCVEAKALESAIKQAKSEGFEAIIGGGGDGTLNTIAAALAGSDIAFGVLPLGTYNHFAKELGVPLDLDQAVKALATAKVKPLDIGEVNGRVFLNFAALGAHPLIVKHRDAQRETRGRKKALALWVALIHVVRRLPLVQVKLKYDDTTLRRITPSVIVCNNAHQMEVFGVADVSATDRSLLNVYMAHSREWYGVAWLILRALVRRVGSAKHFEALVFPAFTLHTRRRHARVSIDGEVMDLETPLEFKVRKGGLKVLAVEGEAK